MKKLLYLIIIFAIISAIDHPLINDFYDKTVGQIKMLASNSTKSEGNVGANSVYQEMEKKFAQYSADEQKAIKKITETNASVLKFQKAYCTNKDFNPKLYGAHLKTFCQVIKRHESALKHVNT